MFEMLNGRVRGAQRVSHLVSVYDQVRRMITFVRWSEGDADAIAPSLYATPRGFHRTASVNEPAPSPPDALVVTPEPVTPEPVAPAPSPEIDPIPGSGPAPFTS
jgi:hypothetical protein